MDTENPQHSRLAADLERRSHFRVECDLLARFSLPDEEQEGEARISNIGFGGARVDLPIDLPIPCLVRLAIDEPGGGKLDLDCEVTWTTTANDTAPYPTGLRFRDIDDALKSRLFEILIDLMNG